MNRPHPDTLEVNQSALESRIVRGMKYSSTCWEERSTQILLRDSTACDCQYGSSDRQQRDWTNLVPDDWLLDSSQILQGRQEYMTPLRTTNVFDEVAEFLTQSDKDLVFVLNRFCKRCQGYVHVRCGGRGRGPSRKGMSSSRVRSAPRARAMVERRRIALRRRMTSSCYVSC